jgi:hypothetical protein
MMNYDYKSMWEELENEIDGAVSLGILLGYAEEDGEEEMRAKYEVYSRIQNIMVELFLGKFESN